MYFLVPLSRTPMFCFLFCFLALPAFSEDQAQKKDSKRVWTNDDLHQLAARPLENATPPTSPGNPSAATDPEKHYVRGKDVKWYASQLKPLHAEVEDI